MGRRSEPETCNVNGYCIEPDGHDEPTVWRATADVRGPEAVVRRCDVGEEAWGLLVAQVESLSAPVPAAPLTEAEVREIAAHGRQAQNDPGAFVERRRDEDYNGDYERLDRWQARALDAAVDIILAARAAAQPPAADRDALADDGQANDCPHHSATGVDTAPIGPGKVWRCDHCGLSWTDQGPALAARPAPDAVPADRVRALADRVRRWADSCDNLARVLDERGDHERADEKRLLAGDLRALLADHQPAAREEGRS